VDTDEMIILSAPSLEICKTLGWAFVLHWKESCDHGCRYLPSLFGISVLSAYKCKMHDSHQIYFHMCMGPETYPRILEYWSPCAFLLLTHLWAISDLCHMEGKIGFRALKCILSHHSL